MDNFALYNLNKYDNEKSTDHQRRTEFRTLGRKI